jgi:hypothetical protein
MIDDKILIEVGRLAVQFNALEHVVKHYLDCCLEVCPSGKKKRRPTQFGEKLKLCKSLFVDFASEKHVLDSNEAQRIVGLLDSCSDIATHRNDVMHGSLALVIETGEYLTYNRERLRAFCPEEIGRAARDAEHVHIELRQAFNAFSQKV